MTATAPIGSSERIGELDVLRGFALLGVFIVHFGASAYYFLPVSSEQQTYIADSALEQSALFFINMFVYDKANTLFTVLFGMGFWVMLERLQSRDAAFGTIYIRRLTALFAFGLINIFLIFPGDVLHIYALLGVLLLAVRSLPMGAMLCIGLALTVFGYEAGEWLVGGTDEAWKEFNAVQADSFAKGDYWNWVLKTGEAFLIRDYVQGATLGWALYIFGRFLLGVWIIRKGWIQRSAELIPQIRRLALVVVPIGLALECTFAAISGDLINPPGWVGFAVHMLGTPILAFGYAMLLILLFRSRSTWLARLFAPVGRVALSAYLGHAIIINVVVFPFFLGLLPIFNPAFGLAFAISLFALMTLAAHWWLARYRYGPLEYLWRWATYGTKPKFLLEPRPATA